jgi:polar amino acid transport system substrate-binding protein
MHRGRFLLVAVGLAAFTLIASACSNGNAGGSSGDGSTSGGPAANTVCASVDTSGTDLLARICKQGSIRVATDQKYKPQSWYDVKTGEWKGFDVDVAREVAKRLGVTADINHQDWEVITAGSWNDRWDISVGSMTDTVPREKLFEFTPPYYYTPAGFAVYKTNTSVQDVTTDLDGKKVCVGVSTTYEDYLKGDLVLGGTAPKFDFVVDNPDIVTFTTDTDALDELALGDGVRCDAAMTATPTIQAYVDGGGAVKSVGDPIYYEPLCMAFDKNDPVENKSLVDAVSTIVDDMHSDGTLTDLSMKWYGVDLTTTSASGPGASSSSSG